MNAPSWAKDREESEVRLEVEDYLLAVDDSEDGRKWLRRLRQRIDEREREIGRTLWEAAAARYWKEEASTWTVGLRVFCNAHGVFLGGTLQRGVERQVIYIQKRARRIWLVPPTKARNRKAWACYSAAALLRYNLRRTPPENPMPDKEAADLARLGEALFGEKS